MSSPRINDISTTSQVIYRSLGLEIDPGRASVFLAGKEVELRAKAFLLLVYLFEHRDRVVSKEELFERIWPDTTVVDATLVGCIQEIRKALGDQVKVPT